MTYIDYLNDFNQWLETNTLPASSQLMYYKLLHVFNRAGWPKDVGVDNLRLMIMTDIKSESTVIRARDKLVEAGFISYKKGKKGTPNRYSLARYTPKNKSISASKSASISTSVSASISDSESDSHIKTKNKTKTISPTTLQERDWGFGKELTVVFSEWLGYKRELGQAYKPIGLKALIAQVNKQSAIYGESAVADVIRLSMANNWQSIVWDKLEKASRPEGRSRIARGNSDSIRREMDNMEKYLRKLKGEQENGEL